MRQWIGRWRSNRGRSNGHCRVQRSDKHARTMCRWLAWQQQQPSSDNTEENPHPPPTTFSIPHNLFFPLLSSSRGISICSPFILHAFVCFACGFVHVVHFPATLAPDDAFQNAALKTKCTSVLPLFDLRAWFSVLCCVVSCCVVLCLPLVLSVSVYVPCDSSTTTSTTRLSF